MKIIEQPSSEPVSLAEAKLHLRVDGDFEDTLIALFISAARQSCEQRIGRSLITQTVEIALDAFPDGAIELRHGPVQSIVSVKYRDTAGNLQTLDPSTYALDNHHLVHWCIPSHDTTWPDTMDVANAVKVRYVAGYGGATEVPQPIKAWLLLAIGDLFNNREGHAEKPTVKHGFYDSLLEPYWIPTV